MKNQSKVLKEFKLEELEQRVEFSFWCDYIGEIPCEFVPGPGSSADSTIIGE